MKRIIYLKSITVAFKESCSKMNASFLKFAAIALLFLTMVNSETVVAQESAEYLTNESASIASNSNQNGFTDGLMGAIIEHAKLIGGSTGENKEIEKSMEKAVSTFDLKSFDVNNEGLMSWTTLNEMGSLPFNVEQFIFDRWVVIERVKGLGSKNLNTYSAVVNLHSGENKFRIRQKGYDKHNRFSPVFTITSDKEPVFFEVKNRTRRIDFSNLTYYVIYNPYGEIVKKEYGYSVDISEFPAGNYCMVYDNRLGGFTKKKTLIKKARFKVNYVKAPRKRTLVL